jgi:adenylate cyclase
VEPAVKSRLSAAELSSLTGEPLDRLERLRALQLIGSDDPAMFTPRDAECIHLITFLERQHIELETIAGAEREQAVLSSAVEFLFPVGFERTSSLERMIQFVGLDPQVARRLQDVAGASDEPVGEHDLRMFREAKAALEAGFPETALLQLVRVYADALARVAEAEVHLFHLYVHEALRAAGQSGEELLGSRKAVRENLLPIVEPLIRYFHHRGMVKAVREDMLLHVAGGTVQSSGTASRLQLRLAILFLDMSSFTPLTEVMGDAVAAQVVDRFSELVRASAGRFEGRVVDRIGDAFLLVFLEPRAAVTCALEIEQRTKEEPQFPAVHGAVHWGDVLYQDGGYVGGALNIASRVAAQAAPHQILVTAAVRDGIRELAGIQLAPLGTQQLKGLAEALELFEVRRNEIPESQRVRDPVCGMEMAADKVAATLVTGGRELAFCCEKCLRAFIDAPQAYADAGAIRR